MPEWTALEGLLAFAPRGLAVMGVFMVPVMGAFALISAKLAQGDAIPKAQRRFLTCLVVVTLLTVRTVMHCDECWLIHMMTLAGMVVGAMALPDQVDTGSVQEWRVASGE